MGRHYLLLKNLLIVFAIFGVSLAGYAQQLELQQTIHTNTQGTSYFWSNDGGGHAIDYDGTHLIYGSPYAYYQAGGYFGGAIFILEKTPAGWSEMAMITAPGFTNLGIDVAIDGDWAFAGASYYGQLNIYKNINGTWTEYQIIDKTAIDKQFARAISYSNGRLVASMNGSSFVYELVNGNWEETAHITGPAGVTPSFGSNVAIDYDDLVITDINHQTSTTSKGTVFHYHFNNGTWTLQNQIACPQIGHTFGEGLAIQGNNLVITDPQEAVNGTNNIGKAYTYTKTGTTWTLNQTLEPVAPANTYYFGQESNICLDGNTLMIGHWGNGNKRAHIYKWEAGNWVLYPEMTHIPNNDLYIYGGGVFVSGDEYFVGSSSVTIPNEPSQPVGGVLYWTPACSISNIVTSNVTCSGDNATFDVSFDAAYSSGTYEIYDTDNNIVLATGTSSPITVTIPGPTTSTTINFEVRDQTNAACTGTGNVDILACPSSPCSLTATIHNGVCFHNYTFSDPTDDIFSLIYQFVTNSNAGPSNSFTITTQGQTFGPFSYGVGGQLDGMPSDGQPFDVVFADVDNPNCTYSLVALSQPCSTCPSFPHSYSSNSPVCEGQSIVFTREAGLGSYEWSGPNGFTSTAIEPIIGNATQANAGTYSVTMTNYLGCTEVATVDVIVTPALSNVDAGTYNDVCQGDGLVPLMGTPAGGTFSGVGVSGDFFDPSVAGAGIHTIEYSVLDDCTGNPVVATTTIQVITTNGTAPTIADISVCEGGSTEISPASTPSPVNIWTESFNENLAGVAGPSKTYTPPSNGQWEIYGNFSKLNRWWKYFKVTSHSLTARATKKKLCFESESIDITGLQNVSFSVDISETGDLEPSDFVDVTYIVDGVSTKIINWQGQGNNNHTLTGKNGANDDDWVSTVVNVDGLSGNSLIIKLCVKNNAGGEYINFDNIVVTHTPTPPNFYFYDADPANGNANLLAGPVTSYNPLTTAQNSPQTIWVSQQNANGCQSLATPVTINVISYPQIQLASNNPVCEGETINITTTGNADQWQWQGPNGFVSTDQNVAIPNATDAESGNYQLVATNQSTCSATSDIDIVVNPTPSTPNTSDITVCESGNTEIFPTGDLPDQVELWSETFNENLAGVTGPSKTYTPPNNGQWEIYGNFSKLNRWWKYFKVTSHSLTARATKKKLCFESESIDITGLQNVSFSVDISETGDLEPSDFVDVTYIVDGVSTKIINWQGQGNNNHTLTGKNGANDDDWVSTVVNVDGLSGNSLIIKLCVKNNAGGEYINFDNIVVSYTPQPSNFYFYDADPANGNANLLAGPTASYDPMTTAQNSPQTVWVTAQNPNCESAASPVVITVGANPVAGIAASDTTFCTNQTLTLTETSGVATNWSWTGPNGFTSTEQSPTIPSLSSANSGTYEVVASTLPQCSSSDSIVIQVQAGSTDTVPCFDLVIPWAGQTIDFTPKSYNFYDADPTLGNANLLVAGASSYSFGPTDVVWITSGDVNGCESAPQQVIVNDPTDIHQFNPNNISFAEVMADYTNYGNVIYPSFFRLAFQVDQSYEIDIFHTFDNALNNTNAIPYPYTVTEDQYAFYRYGDSLCPTICMVHLVPLIGKVAMDTDVHKMGLEIDAGKSKSTLPKSLVLDQNVPNPFQQETVIGFFLPEDGDATLSIFDIAGRLVYQTHANYSKGHHQVTLNKAQLGNTGVLFYQLRTANSASTRRMLFIE